MGLMDPRLRSELRPATNGSLQEVRVFTNPAVQSAIDGALSGVDQNSRGVILEVDMPEAGGVRGVLAARLDKHWSIGLVGAYTGTRKVTAGARIAFQF